MLEFMQLAGVAPIESQSERRCEQGEPCIAVAGQRAAAVGGRTSSWLQFVASVQSNHHGHSVPARQRSIVGNRGSRCRQPPWQRVRPSQLGQIVLRLINRRTQIASTRSNARTAFVAGLTLASLSSVSCRVRPLLLSENRTVRIGDNVVASFAYACRENGGAELREGPIAALSSPFRVFVRNTGRSRLSGRLGKLCKISRALTVA